MPSESAHWPIAVLSKSAMYLRHCATGKSLLPEYWATNGSNSALLVMFKPLLPATRNLRPTDGLASKTVTKAPSAAATSAARRPAGPPPMMAIVRGVLLIGDS